MTDIWKTTRFIVQRRVLRGLDARSRASRERRRYTAAQVAHHTRISRSTMRRLEAGLPVRTNTLAQGLYVVGLPSDLDAVGANDTERGRRVREEKLNVQPRTLHA